MSTVVCWASLVFFEPCGKFSSWVREACCVFFRFWINYQLSLPPFLKRNFEFFLGLLKFLRCFMEFGLLHLQNHPFHPHFHLPTHFQLLNQILTVHRYTPFPRPNRRPNHHPDHHQKNRTGHRLQTEDSKRLQLCFLRQYFSARW